MERQQTQWVVASDTRSIAQARSLIAQELGDVPADCLEVILLLTSELVTNAVRHGTGPVGVCVGRGDGAVRVEVEDESPELPVVREIDRDALHGRGLILVDCMSTGWGVLAGTPGKTVWFTADA